IQGYVKIKVIEGRDLVARDIFTSDPYVKLSIGEHKVSSACKCDCNPSCDSVSTLVSRAATLPVTLFVFDKDFLTADDEMGDAEIDLHPLVSAANAGVDFQEGSNIGRVRRTPSNHFVKDSLIKFNNASLVQEICIKLQNVQKGHIELEVRWQP
ncbi:hypothetical protein KP509_20G090500, partial [Ceratopteris richardii]